MRVPEGQTGNLFLLGTQRINNTSPRVECCHGVPAQTIRGREGLEKFVNWDEAGTNLERRRLEMSERESNGIVVPAGSRSARSAVLGWILASAVLAALVFVLAGSSRAQSQTTESKSAPATSAPSSAQVTPVDTASVTQAATPNPVAGPAAPAGQSAPKGQSEGIKVHGHWTIEVKNPDGTVASHREFENAISTVGPDILTGLLSGEYVTGGFYVVLYGPLCGTGNCLLIDTRNTTNCAACAHLLSYTPNPSSARPSVAAGYTLTGTVGPVSGGGPITQVESGVALCYASFGVSASGTPTSFLQATPQACGNAPVFSATDQILSLTNAPVAAITVTAPQSVSVTVVITFGSS
jgi:hypothetical protein